MTTEEQRLEQARNRTVHWKRWGPYLSERAWGTVREDYSRGGTAWDYFPHDHARSRAYRWNEDGLAGISDRHQRICFALALWNRRDPILKERLFGLAGSEGNHGEDVKEYYFYLDSTPTHSYMRFLYKYPHAAFPYDDLVDQNRRRGKHAPEYERADTGVFDGGRYFDVEVEYAKADVEDILVRINVTNHGPEAASLDVLPTVWFRNTWSWSADAVRPILGRAGGEDAIVALAEPRYGQRWLYCDGHPELLFTDNDTNTERLSCSTNGPLYVTDAFHRYLIHEERAAINPRQSGTKAAALYRIEIPAGQTMTRRLRLTDREPAVLKPFGRLFDDLFTARRREADDFYDGILPS